MSDARRASTISRRDIVTKMPSTRRQAGPRHDAAPPVDYQALADLRYRIRRFLRIREVAARAAGVEPQHYLLLLQIKGLAGRSSATIGALAERLQIQHHGVVQLVNRLAARGMVERRRTGGDRREVVVGLRPAGEAVLQRVASYSVAELRTEAPALVGSLRRLLQRSTRGQPSRAKKPRDSRTSGGG
jgi:DNA-binding MarR family transcriptional regulator